MMAEERGFALYGAFNGVWQGWALTVQGQPVEGIARMREAMASTLSMGTEFIRPYHLALIAAALQEEGEWEEGETLLGEALTRVSTMDGYWWEAEHHRLQGEWFLSQGKEFAVQARDCFTHALEVARSQQAKSLELRAAMSWSRLWQEQGEQVKAREVLAAVYDAFTEGFDTADLQEAKALLNELER